MVDLAKKRGYVVAPYSSALPALSGIRAAGQTVNHDTALTFTGAFAAISIKSENLASLPKYVYQRTANGKKVLSNHPVYKLIHHRPNTYMTDFVFWEFLEASVAGWGNGYAVIERGRDPRFPKELHPAR